MLVCSCCPEDELAIRRGQDGGWVHVFGGLPATTVHVHVRDSGGMDAVECPAGGEGTDALWSRVVDEASAGGAGAGVLTVSGEGMERSFRWVWSRWERSGVLCDDPGCYWPGEGVPAGWTPERVEELVSAHS